jgi:hypothetical protein
MQSDDTNVVNWLIGKQSDSIGGLGEGETGGADKAFMVKSETRGCERCAGPGKWMIPVGVTRLGDSLERQLLSSLVRRK